ncbi:MAG: hypothetical protein C4321_08965 [Chloroflexota bacterium]
MKAGTPQLAVDNWVDEIERHYLDDYIREGGASVKFAVCLPGLDAPTVADALFASATARGFFTARVDAASVKVHMIERVFHAIAEQLRWRNLTDAVLRRLAAAEHWQVPAAFDERPVAEQLAALNGLEPASVSLPLQRAIERAVFRDHSLARDFRLAMTWLARGRLNGGQDGARVEADLIDWLCGRITALSTLRGYQIFTKISRTNARHMLGSLLRWVRSAGGPGLVVAVDATRLFARERATDGLNYTIPALLDAYEVFREFIDATDELEGLLLVVLVPPAFTDIDPRGRGLARYPALMYRVIDEVHDERLANPLTALVRLTTEVVR